MLLAPGVGVDIDGVAVLSEAVDEGDDAGGAGEDGAPLLEGEIRGDDRRAVLMAAADDVIEEVGGAVIAWEIAKLVEDEQVGGGVSAEAPLERGEGFLSQEVGEGGGQRREADGEAVLECDQAEALREHGFAHARRSAEQDVVAAVGEVEREELLDEDAIDMTRVRPIGNILRR